MTDSPSRLYATEVNALEMRTKGTALAAAIQWIIVRIILVVCWAGVWEKSEIELTLLIFRQNYMVVQVTPDGLANLEWRFFIIWACLCFSFIPITYLFFPETGNRTLENIDRYFESKPGIIVAWDKGIFWLHVWKRFSPFADNNKLRPHFNDRPNLSRRTMKSLAMRSSRVVSPITPKSRRELSRALRTYI